MHDVLEDMRVALELRAYRPNTVALYLRYARRFLREVPKPLEELSHDDVVAWLHRLARRGLSAQTRNVALAATRMLLEIVGRAEVVAKIKRARERRKVPMVLSGTEVHQLLRAIGSPTHRAMVAVMYGAGLRVSEMCHLRIQDIDSKRMLLRVVEGKTGDRFVRLSPRLLEALRQHWRARRPKGPYLFPGRAGRPVTRAAVAKVLGKVCANLGFEKRVHPHALRHSFAVHLLELGADVRTVQLMLGHQRITSTMQYLHLTQVQLARAPSPLDVLGSPKARRLG